MKEISESLKNIWAIPREMCSITEGCDVMNDMMLECEQLMLDLRLLNVGLELLDAHSYAGIIGYTQC